ncbi:MAG: GNAT family N-acetyltransferase [Gaiellaceae bacterium]
MDPRPDLPITLRDGSRIRIRQLRGSDGELLVHGFEHLSSESRYRRFLAPTLRLSGRAIRNLTETDRREHEAVIALDPETGEAIALGEYVRSAERQGEAEVALTVTDDWQDRGVGTVLLGALCARAREDGISSFTALMLSENAQMMELLEHVGQVRVVDRQGDTVEVQVRI